MQILCTICSDLLYQTENLLVTTCGHIFHHQCLRQWISRSQTCPQCRNKVTDRCMFRIYPTITNEVSDEDIATVQSKLDNVVLQLREQKTVCKEKGDRIYVLETELKKTEEILNSYERKLVCSESAVNAMKQQINYLHIQNREVEKLKKENEDLRSNIQTMTGLQKVLNATTQEVEMMLQGYPDVRTIATFATALKRALCESESKKTESRDRLLHTTQQLADEKNANAELKAKLRSAETQISELRENLVEAQKTTKEFVIRAIDHVSFPDKPSNKNERQKKQPPITEITNDYDVKSLVTSLNDSGTPYLKLKRNNFALTAIEHNKNTTEDSGKQIGYAILKCYKMVPEDKESNGQNPESKRKRVVTGGYLPLDQNLSYDGLGGHSKPNVFPVPKQAPAVKGIPKVSAKHRLKRPSASNHEVVEKFMKRAKK